MPLSTGAKAAFRTQIRRAASALTDEARVESDRLLTQRFLSLPQLEGVGSILLFWGVGTEVDTASIREALWAGGKQVLLPRCLPGRGMEARAVSAGASLVPGTFGIPEPGEDCPVVERECIGLILVPGLCYDRHGYRLGQGGGYYDRYLVGFQGRTLGLCRDALLQARVPAQSHDVPVDLVLTETLTIWSGGLSAPAG